jgi:hypothetical protein
MSDLLREEGAAHFLGLVPHAEFADVAGAGHMVAGDRNDLSNNAVVVSSTACEPTASFQKTRGRIAIYWNLYVRILSGICCAANVQNPTQTP